MRYPKPGPVGGKLIREVVGSFKKFGNTPRLPIGAHILIAVSGGVDSMALANLLVRYGRRVGRTSKIRLVHINHGWRGEESDADEALVRAAARRLGVPVSVFRLKPPGKTSRSLEEVAREERKKIFDRLIKKYSKPGKPAWILTAHHADDLAETLIWRFFTGTLNTHGAGIAFRNGQEIRPFLRSKKRDLRTFLEEEGERWSEDRTNFEARFLRSRIRMELLPIVEHLFPGAVDRISRQGLRAQLHSESAEALVDPSVLFSAAGLKLRRAHWQWLGESLRLGPAKNGLVGARQLTLPGGWVLKGPAQGEGERWVLERLE